MLRFHARLTATRIRHADRNLRKILANIGSWLHRLDSLVRTRTRRAFVTNFVRLVNSRTRKIRGGSTYGVEIEQLRALSLKERRIRVNITYQQEAVVLSIRLGSQATANVCSCIVALLFTAVTVATSCVAQAANVNVAVAANFTEPAKEIARMFESKSGHNPILSFGATGQFYTQITQAAPFQVLLSADQDTPRKLVSEGLAVSDSLFTYAVGKLVLFSRDATLVAGEQTLHDGKFNKIAIANPTTAPYGAAAVETMKALKVFEALASKIVQGNNIAQTYQFVETGNADLAFLPLSQTIS